MSSGCVVAIMKTMCGGGSSSVLSSAFCAEKFISSAGSMIATFLLPEKAR